MVHLSLLAEDLALSVDSTEFDLVPAGTVALELEKHLEIQLFDACDIKEAIHFPVRATGEQRLTLYSTTCIGETCVYNIYACHLNREICLINNDNYSNRDSLW